MKATEDRFKLKLKHPEHYWMKGIYKITIGRMVYVGKALTVGTRMYQHELSINSAIKNYSRLVNIGPKSDDERRKIGYLSIAKYIQENPSITYGTVEVIERQVCSNRLYFSENFYLKEFAGNPDCYNISRAGSLPKGTEDNLWEAVVAGESIEYFDPRIPKYRLSSSGNNNQNKKILEQIKEHKETKPYKIQRLQEKRERLLGDNPSLQRRMAVTKYILEEIQAL